MLHLAPMLEEVVVLLKVLVVSHSCGACFQDWVGVIVQGICQ